MKIINKDNKPILTALKNMWSLSEMQRKGFKIVDRKETAKKKKAVKEALDKYKKTTPQIVNKKVRNASKVTPKQFFTYQKVNYRNEHNITFPSKLEWYAFDTFQRNGLAFDYQFPFELQAKQSDARPIKTIIDFVFHVGAQKIIVDTKGHQTNESKLKIKMLRSKLMYERIDYEIILLRTTKQILDFTKKMIIAKKNGIFAV